MRPITLAVVVLSASTSLALACGTERWPVKVGSDPDVGQVAPTAAAAATTIAALTGIPAPRNPNIRQNTRFAPVETNPVTVSGILVVIKREPDQDYHLVIADPQLDLSIIVESPDPGCAPGSRYAQEIAQVRQTIESVFRGPIVRRLEVQVPVTVTGIPFFDPLHGQEGVAQNGIELHPILAIQFQ
jgi:hypothetical protein